MSERTKELYDWVKNAYQFPQEDFQRLEELHQQAEEVLHCEMFLDPNPLCRKYVSVDRLLDKLLNLFPELACNGNKETTEAKL
jgi:hypothetical protein